MERLIQKQLNFAKWWWRWRWRWHTWWSDRKVLYKIDHWSHWLWNLTSAGRPIHYLLFIVHLLLTCISTIVLLVAQTFTCCPNVYLFPKRLLVSQTFTCCPNVYLLPKHVNYCPNLLFVAQMLNLLPKLHKIVKCCQNLLNVAQTRKFFSKRCTWCPKLQNVAQTCSIFPRLV